MLSGVFSFGPLPTSPKSFKQLADGFIFYVGNKTRQAILLSARGQLLSRAAGRELDVNVNVCPWFLPVKLGSDRSAAAE